MKLSKYSEPQILGVLHQPAGGTLLSALCRKNGMSSALFCRWRFKVWLAGRLDAVIDEGD